jgi:hypothetical protein
VTPLPIIDEDRSYTYYSRASGQPGIVAVPRNGGPSQILRAPKGQKLACMVPPRAAAEGSIAESLKAYAAARDDNDFAPLPESPWPTPPMPAWRPPAPPVMHSSDYAPMVEPDWTKPRPASSAKPAPAAAADDSGYMPVPPSIWDR